MDQLALLEVPEVAPPRRPRRPRVRPEIIRAVQQAVRAARASYGHQLDTRQLDAIEAWAQAFEQWLVLRDLAPPAKRPLRPRTTTERVWALSRLAHWATTHDLYLEGCTAAELRTWCTALARWSEG